MVGARGTRLWELLSCVQPLWLHVSLHTERRGHGPVPAQLEAMRIPKGKGQSLNMNKQQQKTHTHIHTKNQKEQKSNWRGDTQR